MTQTVHFDVSGGDLVAGVAAFRASSGARVSGEPPAQRDNGTARTTVAAAPGDCATILILLGLDVAIPTITTTPIGRSSYSVPGVSRPTLGLTDVSLDLQLAMNSTSGAGDPAAAVDRENVTNEVTFTTLATSALREPALSPPYTEAQANLIVVGTSAFIAPLDGLVAYRHGRPRGRT